MLWQARSCVLPHRGSPSRAAVRAISQKHELDAVEQKIDRQPPVQVEARVVSVVRGRAPGGSSCDDIGVIVIELVRPVDDDRTPREKLGYRITHVEGTLLDA